MDCLGQMNRTSTSSPGTTRKKTFHTNWFPLLADLLESKGWSRAARGQPADVCIWLERTLAEEEKSQYRGTKLRFFSRAYTDCITNKRSIVVAVENGGCKDVMPPCYYSFAKWKKVSLIAHCSHLTPATAGCVWHSWTRGTTIGRRQGCVFVH